MLVTGRAAGQASSPRQVGREASLGAFDKNPTPASRSPHHGFPRVLLGGQLGVG